jgi:pimeloyl-ACP methyl ester carboxylesterase
MSQPQEQHRWVLPFCAGLLAGGAGLLLARALADRRGLDVRLLRSDSSSADVPPLVVVPGIMGCELLRPDGTPVWLNVRNAMGHYDLSLPLRLPLAQACDDLVPGGLLGADAVLPRLFGFTEYADLLELLEDAGFSDGRRPAPSGARRYHVFAYDWRRDLVDSARRLDAMLQALAEQGGDPDARFNVLGHSMGGLVARYYLRYGTAEPADGAPVSWAGARRIRSLVLVAVPNSGSIPALEGILLGNRVGLSSTTLAAQVVAGMPSVYQLLPPRGAPALVDARGDAITADLHDIATWERFGWGPFAPPPGRRRTGIGPEHREFVEAVLARAALFHRALAHVPETPCPTRTLLLGGDCLPTLARALVDEKRSGLPRFEPWSRAEADAMLEAGDGRVTRDSVMAAHLPEAAESEIGCGLAEVSQAFIGAADHHGIYQEPTFQSILLRALLRGGRPPVARAVHAARPA